MAQTTETITFAQCGHTDRVQVRHNSASERDRKREWLADTALCPACDLAEKAETAAKSDLVEQEARARRAEAEVARLTAERDALAAQVARVEEVLDHWRTVDEGNAAYAERIGERSRFADGLASRADMLRAALAGSEADTSDTNPARARYADGDPAGCYCTCSDDAREGCEHEPDEPQPTDLAASSRSHGPSASAPR